MILGALSIAGLLSVWFVSSQTPTYQARSAYVALVAIYGRTAPGLERWRRPCVPTAGRWARRHAGGHRQDVLAAHWT
jgi:hypothetical protein